MNRCEAAKVFAGLAQRKLAEARSCFESNPKSRWWHVFRIRSEELNELAATVWSDLARPVFEFTDFSSPDVKSSEPTWYTQQLSCLDAITLKTSKICLLSEKKTHHPDASIVVATAERDGDAFDKFSELINRWIDRANGVDVADDLPFPPSVNRCLLYTSDAADE